MRSGKLLASSSLIDLAIGKVEQNYSACVILRLAFCRKCIRQEAELFLFYGTVVPVT